MTNSRTYTILAFAGTVPFLACALLIVLGIEAIEPLGPLDALASSYATVIVSFLAGVHWATDLFHERRTQPGLFVSSNVVLLFVWFAFVLVPILWQLSSQVIALLALVLIDRQLQRQAIISSHYLRTRLAATTLAAGSLIVIILAG
jgi:hypothetical protein